MQALGKINEDGSGITLVPERRSTEKNLVDAQGIVQIELDPRVVFEHFEADRVLSADELFLWIDANIKVVKQQIVVGTIRAVSSAQNVGLGGLTMTARHPRRGRWLRNRRRLGGQQGSEQTYRSKK
jgi:hypothetical protein